MIITLRNADFSNNNIGHIDIPCVLSDWSKAIIAKFSSFNWTDDAKSALQIFEDNLISSGVREKLQYLALPILAANNSLDDAMFNVILESSVAATIGDSATDKYTVINGRGIARTAPFASITEVANSIHVPFIAQEFAHNFHIMSYTPEDWPMPTTDWGSTKIRLGDNTFNSPYNVEATAFSFRSAIQRITQKDLWKMDSILQPDQFLTVYPPAMGAGTNPSIEGRPAYGDPNFSTRGVPLIGSNDGTHIYLSLAEQDYVQGNSGGPYAIETTQPEATMPDKIYAGLLPIDIDNSWVARYYAALGWGECLTNTEGKAYQRALTKFVTALKSL